MAAHLSAPGKWEQTRHQRFLGELLADRISRGGARIVLHEPPRHGKSEIVSKWTPSWTLSTWPDWPILLGSFEARFAASWGRKTRDVLVNNPCLGVTIRKGAHSAEGSWETSEGGGMHCAGIGGPFTGRGGKLLIVDDPIKNAKEAFSAIVRESHWQWWKTTAYTRLEKDASAIVMMTRWTEDDLAGRLLAQAQEGGEPWEYVCLPALAEAGDPLDRVPGEPLWPAKFGLKELARIRTGIDAATWAAMYQGRPLRGVGKLFQRGWFKIVGAVPSGMRKVRFWDLAGSELKPGKDPDWTVGLLLGLFKGVWFVLDVRRIRGSPGEVEELIKQTAKLDGTDVAIWMEQEGGASAIHVLDHYRRTVLVGYNFRGEVPKASKELRARPVSAAAEAGNIRLLEGSWVKAYLDEMEQFPTPGVHDDQVDATSGAFSKLAGAGVATLF